MCPGETASIEYLLTVDVEQAVTDMRKVEAVLMRTFALMEKAGLPPHVVDAINKLQRFIMTLRMAQQALMLISTALIPGAGIVAQIMAIIGVTSTAFVAADTYDYMRGAE